MSWLKEHIQSLWIPLSSSSLDEALLQQTFTHKSFSADTPEAQIPYNERLEFLGDSILGGLVAIALYRKYPDIAESQLTLTKIYLVREDMLAKVARDIDLWHHLRLGNGEERSGWRDKDAVLSDALEALIGYLYLNHGRETVASFIEKYIMSQLEGLQSMPGKSWKSRLQEFAQKKYQELPVYEDFEADVEDSGNVLQYGTKVYVQWWLLAQATWASKKKAQETAAEMAFKKLNR